MLLYRLFVIDCCNIFDSHNLVDKLGAPLWLLGPLPWRLRPRKQENARVSSQPELVALCVAGYRCPQPLVSHWIRGYTHYTWWDMDMGHYRPKNGRMNIPTARLVWWFVGCLGYRLLTHSPIRTGCNLFGAFEYRHSFITLWQSHTTVQLLGVCIHHDD